MRVGKRLWIGTGELAERASCCAVAIRSWASLDGPALLAGPQEKTRLLMQSDWSLCRCGWRSWRGRAAASSGCTTSAAGTCTASATRRRRSARSPKAATATTGGRRIVLQCVGEAHQVRADGLDIFRRQRALERLHAAFDLDAIDYHRIECRGAAQERRVPQVRSASAVACLPFMTDR